ncbi:rubrerythrin family protein [Halocalculus aciditolerans]|uniref:Rubrerythrin family protein n=1 Tax=Halocalculus aciditolerans TaxID=1383812 RepID=A0A830FFF2_9EURY|nr:rubrerythrin family protein [Halocalculus aciditolerans]GGL69630.1 hypothetical protein GCM10009039_29510 [Halocalculus aciditolerans]
MDASEFTEHVREANETALSRLGSSKSLYAATGGEMDTEDVLHAAADAERAAAETFEQWAATSEGVPAGVYTATAEEEREHYETVAGELDDHEPGDAVSAMQAALRDLTDPVERVGGYVGRLEATDKSKEQYVGFFVGQADPQTAQLFRGLRDDLDGQRDRIDDLLDAVCEDDADVERALDAASTVIQAAYDEYTEQLESLGVNPKPVC